MEIGDKVKTRAWVKITDDEDYLHGKIHDINNQKCIDGSVFEKIMVKFNDDRILPCIREEFE